LSSRRDQRGGQRNVKEEAAGANEPQKIQGPMAVERLRPQFAIRDAVFGAFPRFERKRRLRSAVKS
jgi:hypothetical protein